MVKKPILTDDELDGAFPPPAPGAVPPLPPTAGGSATRPVDDTPQPPVPPSSVTRPLEDSPATPPPPLPPLPPTPPSPPSAAESAGRDASGHARPKTRIHGYGGPARDEADGAAIEAAPPVAPCVGWLVVVAGPGRGASCPLVAGMNAIGRGEGNAVMLDFGDDTISRDPHAFVTYDNETRLFHINHAGKTNIVRRNNAPVLVMDTLTSGDTIRIGATSLRFVALCGPDFDWADA